MSVPISVSDLRNTRDQFVVSHGKSGAVGVFTAPEPLTLRRGQPVVLQTFRGVEVGTVLCPASLLQARVLGATSSGALLRPLSADDEASRADRALVEQELFDLSRSWQRRDGLDIEILDVELLFDGRKAIIQFVGAETDTAALAAGLETHFGVTVLFENLAHAAPADGEDHAHGCDKPECGRTADGGGGCTTCSTGGGCSSCGSAKVDMTEYFGHLRTQMESKQRFPLA